MGQPWRADIDGLRAVAVLPVVAYHAFPSLVPGGFTGVDVFFVISGFLIANIFLSEHAAGRVDLVAFYARRIVRLFPALLAVLAAVLAIGWSFATPQEYRLAGMHVLAAPVFVSNFVLAAQDAYFVEPLARPLLHLWSLAVEAQFYLAAPVLILLALKHPRRGAIVIGGVTAASLGVCVAGSDDLAAYYSPVARAWEFLAGSLLALAGGRLQPARTSHLVAAGGLGLIVAGCFMARPQGFPGWMALLPVLGAVLVIGAGAHAAPNARLLAHPVLVALGKISYPLYLWHWVLLWANATAFDYPPSPGGRLLAIAASVVLATLTYLWVERPMRRLAPAVSAKRLLGAAVVTSAAAGSVVAAAGVPDRVPPAARAWLASSAHAGAEVPDCLLGTACAASGKRPLIAVWGDSHAARLAHGLQQVAARRGGEVIALTALSCPPLEGFAGRGSRECASLSARALAVLERLQPDVLVLHARWDAYPHDRLPQTAARLGALAQRAIVAGPVPRWDGSLPRTLMRCAGTEPLERWSRCGLDPASASADLQMEGAARDAGLRYWSLYRDLCNPQGCMRFTTGAQGALTTYDYGHLSPQAALHVANAARHLLLGGVSPAGGH